MNNVECLCILAWRILKCKPLFAEILQDSLSKPIDENIYQRKRSDEQTNIRLAFSDTVFHLQTNMDGNVVIFFRYTFFYMQKE